MKPVCSVMGAGAGIGRTVGALYESGQSSRPGAEMKTLSRSWENDRKRRRCASGLLPNAVEPHVIEARVAEAGFSLEKSPKSRAGDRRGGPPRAFSRSLVVASGPGRDPGNPVQTSYPRRTRVWTGWSMTRILPAVRVFNWPRLSWEPGGFRDPIGNE